MKFLCRNLPRAAAITCILLSGAAAGEEIKYRSMHHRTDVTWHPVGDVEGHGTGSYTRKGFAFFADGEEASHTQAGTFEYTGSNGTYYGHVTITFKDGSTIIERFEGSQDGNDLAGTSVLVKGTGRFEGIAGTGKHTCEVEPNWRTDTLNIVVCEVVITKS